MSLTIFAADEYDPILVATVPVYVSILGSSAVDLAATR
jgi:hypothetical protein